MKENFRLGGILLIITFIAGLLLGLVNNLTKDAIIENSKISKDDLALILPAAEGIEDMDISIDEEGSVKEVYKAVGGNKTVGYVLKVSSKGFHGPIDFVVAISEADKVSGVKVLAHSETPGLGAKITEEKFTSRFSNKLANKQLEVVKVESDKENEVQAISGATVSSNASVKAVNDAIEFYNEFIKGVKLEPSENTDVNTGASNSEEAAPTTEESKEADSEEISN